MRTQCSLQDLALLAALARSPLEKLTLAQRAVLLAEGPTFLGRSPWRTWIASWAWAWSARNSTPTS